MYLLVTAPPGREGDAILELEWALGRVKVKGTDWRGVLLAETPLSKEEALQRLKDFERQAIQRVVPLERLVPLEEIEKAVLELGKAIDGTFAVRVKVRGNRLSARGLEVKLGSLLVERYNLRVNLSEPDYTVFVEVLGKRAGVGLAGRESLLGPGTSSDHNVGRGRAHQEAQKAGLRRNPGLLARERDGGGRALPEVGREGGKTRSSGRGG